MGGGLGFASLLDVQMLGFYQAQQPSTQRHFLAYVLQVSTPDGPFLVYRRYSQVAGLAAKLHFHPAVGLPPKYALQVFPLSEAQLRQRFEGLRAFLADVFTHLVRQFADGRQHDASSAAGLDMQVFADFCAHQRNHPPRPVKDALPDWARPPAEASPSASPSHGPRRGSWHDADSVTDSEDVGLVESDGDGGSSSADGNADGEAGGEADAVDAQAVDEKEDEDERRTVAFRNELLQAEGGLNALWNCVRTYVQATDAWCSAAAAVADEFQRVGGLTLLRRESAEQPQLQPHTRIAREVNAMVAQLQPVFERRCEDEVLEPLEELAQRHLADIKQAYWTRLPNASATGAPTRQFAPTISAKRLVQEREALQDKLREDVQRSVTALLRIQSELLEGMANRLRPLEVMAGREALVDCSECPQEVLKQTPDDDIEAGSPTGPELDERTSEAVESALQEVGGGDGGDDGETGIEAVQDLISLRERKDEEEEEEEGEEASRMWIWGRPPNTESGTPLFLRPKRVAPLNGQSIVQVACGGEHILYLTATGDVYSYGDNEENKFLTRGHHSDTFLMPHLVEELALEKALHRTRIVKVACGAQHSVGITSGGELFTWGSGEDGRLGHGDMRDRALPRKVMSLLKERVVHASCGGAHTAVLTDRGAVFTFGRGRNGRLGLGDNKWRDTPHEITAFSASEKMALVTCGWNFTVALARSGDVFSWGKQGEGQCGLGYLDKDQLVPRRVDKLVKDGAKVVNIACGYTHTLALTSGGDVYSWGLGEYGQLGRGMVYQPVPERVDFGDVLCAPDRIMSVYCGAFHSVATTAKRVLFAWGLNAYGACGLGHTSNKDAPERIDCFSPDKTLVVACGHKYTVALELDSDASDALLADQRQLSSSSLLHPLMTLSVTTTGLEGDDSGDSPWSRVASPPVQHGHQFLRDDDYSVDGRRSPPSALFSSDAGTPGGSDTDRQGIREKEEELRRAKKLWRTRILRNWEESKDTPLAHSLWRQGIPPSIRARVWPLAIGNKLKITPDMYQIYRKRTQAYKREQASAIGREHTLSLIDTDLPRTFPSLKLFDAASGGPYYAFLLEVLETYACYRPDLGYIQGMSYLAAMLCLHMPQDRYLAFQCLANLMVHEHLFTFYLLDAELSGVYYVLFETFLKAQQPALHAHLRSLGISSAMYLMNWLQTLFLQVLPLELAARVFDNFLLDGTVFLFRVAMAIHELLAPELLRAELDEALPLLQRSVVFQALWLERLGEDALFQRIATIAVPSDVYAALDRVVNDAFFYEKRGGSGSGEDASGALRRAGGGQSVGIGRVKHERRRMYSISDTLNGVLGGF
jgi:alpha-tubulin suppressor-like RCC1 family protein